MCNPRHHGFTLLEMLLALTLTALLMAAVSMLLDDTAQAVDAMDASPVENDASLGNRLAQTMRIIQRDLEGAFHVEATGKKQLMIERYQWIESTGRHEPVRLTYELWGDDLERWLIRREERLTSQVNVNVVANVVTHGLSHFEVQTQKDQATLNDNVPATPSLVLVFSFPDEIVMREVIKPQ